MENISLLNKLAEYCNSNAYPFHMPGHKRRELSFPNPWSIDITEIDGFDNLHHAEGILRELQNKAASIFGAEKSFCLVNGSTCGLLAAISACVKPGGKLLMSRNCHKAVYHALHIWNITPVYLMPEITDFGITGSLSPEHVAAALQEHPDVEAILVVSPTYDGIVSDIKSIAQLAHTHNIPLIVDEAHGAHLPLSDHFPDSALKCGADVVIQSLHKTLPAFTQTAVLHLNSPRVSEDKVRYFLNVYQTSSPSYLLLTSIDSCLMTIQSEGANLLQKLKENLSIFYNNCHSLNHVAVFQCKNICNVFDWDCSKILISAGALGLSGQALSDLLRKRYHLEMEMSSGHYVLALTSMMDTAEGFQRLFSALKEIDEMEPVACSATSELLSAKLSNYPIPKQKMSISDALEHRFSALNLLEAEGKVSAEYLYLYPPGIPLLVPGEEISGALLENLQRLKKLGLRFEGLADTTNERIKIVNSFEL